MLQTRQSTMPPVTSAPVITNNIVDSTIEPPTPAAADRHSACGRRTQRDEGGTDDRQAQGRLPSHAPDVHAGWRAEQGWEQHVDADRHPSSMFHERGRSQNQGDGGTDGAQGDAVTIPQSTARCRAPC